MTYRPQGPIGDAVYATACRSTPAAPGYNAPSANISDRRLLGDGRDIDLLIGGDDPGDSRPWLPLVADDFLVMVRLYHEHAPESGPALSITRWRGPGIMS